MPGLRMMHTVSDGNRTATHATTALDQLFTEMHKGRAFDMCRSCCTPLTSRVTVPCPFCELLIHVHSESMMCAAASWHCKKPTHSIALWSTILQSTASVHDRQWANPMKWVPVPGAEQASMLHAAAGRL